MSAIAVRLFRRMAAALVSYLPGMTARVPVVVLMLAALAVPVAAQESVEYYGTDALGSIRVVFDQSGGVIGRADYMPFGEEVSSSAGVPVERYTGQQRDGEIGLDYFNARMLQPRIGRFASIDPASGAPKRPQSWNRYAYVSGNPLSRSDPSGAVSVAISCGGGL